MANIAPYFRRFTFLVAGHVSDPRVIGQLLAAKLALVESSVADVKHFVAA